MRQGEAIANDPGTRPTPHQSGSCPHLIVGKLLRMAQLPQSTLRTFTFIALTANAANCLNQARRGANESKPMTP